MSAEKVSSLTIPQTLQEVSSDTFVQTDYVRSIADRALTYIQAGYPIHFRGPAGTGKTSLALHIAECIGQPIVMIYGDDEFGSSDLVGSKSGFKRKRLVDNYIHSVYKLEDSVSEQWVDSRLTTAIRQGYTLIYDEFTRSRPEANNILLGVLEEKMLSLPPTVSDGGYVHVNPRFTAIFTSNPEEYAGVHKTQDALRDRMITIDIDHFDEETEIAITCHRSGVNRDEAEKIVRIVRGLRATGIYDFTPTLRSFIMIARIVSVSGAKVASNDKTFVQACVDVLLSETSRLAPASAQQGRVLRARAEEEIHRLIETICPPEAIPATEPINLDRPIGDLRPRFELKSEPPSVSSRSGFYPRRK